MARVRRRGIAVARSKAQVGRAFTRERAIRATLLPRTWDVSARVLFRSRINAISVKPITLTVGFRGVSSYRAGIVSECVWACRVLS